MKIKNKAYSKIAYFLLLIVTIIFIGTLGFSIIEDWSLFDSFYMTVITVTTVGFSEVHALSDYGKLFTAILLFFTFGTFAFSISSLTSYIVGGEYKKYLQMHNTMKKLQNLNNHIVVCGYGRVGKQVVLDLQKYHIEFVVVEKSKEVVESNENIEGGLFLFGDSTDDKFLLEAGIDRARAVITCLPKDSDNLYVVLAAREHNQNGLIVSRASMNNAVSKLKMAGAHNVIMPDSVGGAHMASLIVNRDVMEFLDVISVPGSAGANIQSISFSELPGEFRSKSIAELDRDVMTGVRIVGYKSLDGEYIINPSQETVLSSGSRVFVLGDENQINNFLNKFNLQ